MVSALVAGFVALVLLFPGSGIDRQPPECYAVFGYVVPCEAWVAWAVAAAVAGFAAFGPLGEPSTLPSTLHGSTRRIATAFGAFVLAWLAAAVLARWLFGSGNILVWVIAALIGAVVYLALRRQERRVG